MFSSNIKDLESATSSTLGGWSLANVSWHVMHQPVAELCFGSVTGHHHPQCEKDIYPNKFSKTLKSWLS